MRVYGYDDTGPLRGELVQGIVRQIDLDFGMAIVAAELGWEKAFTKFDDAKRSLLNDMIANDADPEIVRVVRQLKASYVPIVGELS